MLFFVSKRANLSRFPVSRRAFATALTAITVLSAAPSVVWAQTYTLSTLALFNGVNNSSPNGANPYGGVVLDSSGNLYGTTYAGNSNNNSSFGTVFKITAGTNALTTLVNFNGGNGQNPAAGLTIDSSGNLYGTTAYGNNGTGNAFKITAGTNTLTNIANFNGFFGAEPRGSTPFSNLKFDSSGNLYGTTIYGGSNGYGTIFKIAAGATTATTLFNFDYNTTGANPMGGITIDSSGNLYGTTSTGGSGNYGTVFKIAAGTNNFSTLVNFNQSNGESPRADLALDSSGNLYGTTYNGGANNSGTLFKINTTTNAFSTLVNFNTNTIGGNPYGGLTVDALGNLFGTTSGGGPTGVGTVFRIAAGTNTVTNLATFNGDNGQNPRGNLTFDNLGNIYGTTYQGGTGGEGTVFKLTLTVAAIGAPEPGTLPLLTSGALLGLAVVRRRRALRRQDKA